ncbi:fibronectin type III domain-containing protein [Cellulomonas sp. DKR-3]|uniref:Fibronectin type III domain-containing protein n=1 Tax=Cellulomonas fulva TaxID=2835530 RepID=A0ABS5U1C5_9CELL|nr:fibronectin type III domain-containing protein [Cellulomonas fulva]MBT0995194.1 fibronectin type III domain-containing protein [Cellulomonas fulva]
MILRRTAAALVTAALVVVGGSAAVIAPATAATTVLLAAPVNLATRVVNDDTQYTWDGVDGATGYTIEVATDDQFATSNIVATRTTTARTWIPERMLGSTDGRTLYWRVAAHSSGTTAASRGDFSEPALVDVEAARTPTLLSPSPGAVVDYPAPVSFRWSPVEGAVSYTLTYSSSPDWAAGVTTTVAGVTGTAHTPTAPLARTSAAAPVQWYWKVQAVFANPSSATSTTYPVTGPAQAEAGTFSVRWTAAASAPSLLAPVGTDMVQSDLKFTWTTVPGAATYKIEIGQSVDNATGAVTTLIDTGQTTSTSYVPLKQLVDGNYFWQVTAYDPAGKPGQRSTAAEFRKAWGAQSASTTSASGFAKTYPFPTFGSTDIAQATAVPLDRIMLTWDPVARATLYEVVATPINERAGDPDAPADTRKALTCRTASTSATVVARVDEGANTGSMLEGDQVCLWNGSRNQRMDAGGLYEWKVRAIDYSGSATTAIQATTPAGSQESQWSDVDDGDLSRKRYFRVLPTSEPTTTTTVVNEASWTTQSTSAVGKPAPVMEWAPVLGANAYEVAVYSDQDCTAHVSTQYTMQTRLLVNGVFDDETSGAYCWRVRGISMNEAFTQITLVVGSVFSEKHFWQKSSTPVDFVGVDRVTTAPDGSIVFAWRPQALSAPADGGSRGYAVTILDSSLNSKGTVKVEYPWYVAKTPDAQQKPLAPGTYYFKVAALDALGNAGNYTENVGFEVAGPRPTHLDQTVDGTTATLTWTGTTAAAKYGVKVRPVGAAWPTTTTQVTQAAATVRDLDDGAYEWLVFSYDDSGYTSLEATTGAFSVAAPVPALTTPTGTVLTSDDRVLDWEPVPGASRYLVQYSAAAGSLDSAAAAETMATSYAIPTTLAYGTTYYWQVTAVPEKASTSSTRVKLGRSSVSAFSVVNPPATVSLSKVTATGTEVTATWTTPTGAARGSADAPAYRLAYRASNGTGATSEWTVLEIESGAVSRTLTGLDVSTTYEFQLQAYNAEGSSAWSTSKSVSTPGAPTAAVTALTASPTVDSLKVSWRAPSSSATGGSPITGYAVAYRKGAGAWVEVPANRTSTATTATLTGLTSKSSYTVSVAPLNAVGEGPAATLSAVTLGLPSAPKSVKVVRGDRSAAVTWTAPSANGGSAITGYTVERRVQDPKTKAWSGWSAAASTSASTLTTNLGGLTNGVAYQVRVAARSQVGTGAFTAPVTFKPAGRPSAPTAVKATATAGKITLRWTKSVANGSTIASYQVKYSLNGSTWYTMPKVAATSTSTVLKPTKRGKTYSFKVTALSNVGASPASTVVKVVAK